MIKEDKRNGFGLKYGQGPNEPVDFYEPWFDYAEMLAPAAGESLVLGGEPGAGKSHIAEDIFRIGYEEGSSVAFISTHINSGSASGRGATSEIMQFMATAAHCDEKAVVVLDNFDFLVYSGGKRKRRSEPKIRDYFEHMSGLVLGAVDAGCAITATVHNDSWLENHTKWTPTSLLDDYDDLLSELGEVTSFKGEVNSLNAIELLQRRGFDADLAGYIAMELCANNGLFFRQAHHIDPIIIQEQGVVAAMEVVKAKKQEMIDGVQ